MARFTHLPIYKKSFALLVIIEDIVLSMERRSRFTIGADLRNNFRAFVVLITKSNSIRDNALRIGSIDMMFELINEVFILLSVMKELKLFNKSNQYEQILEQVYDIERQME